MPEFLQKIRRHQQSLAVAHLSALIVAGLVVVGTSPVAAQNSPSGWSTGVLSEPNTPGKSQLGNGQTTTVLPRKPAPAPAVDLRSGTLALTAFLTSEIGATRRRAIDRGLIWRVFTIGTSSEPAKLVVTQRVAQPTLKLPVGKYAINAAFGRAHLTRIIDVLSGPLRKEPFILNAGGLRVVTKVVGGGIARDKARFDIFSDERNQSGARLRVVTNARPGLITRLNSGIYHIVSRLGDANALVSAEVAVEAGKLTEAVVSHEAAKVTFKLVKSEAGEAHADTQWIILSKSGDIIKETAGALPTHVLAPGTYSVSARWGGKNYTRTFDVRSGKSVEVEVMMR